jgi:hypothetical protein
VLPLRLCKVQGNDQPNLIERSLSWLAADRTARSSNHERRFFNKLLEAAAVHALAKHLRQPSATQRSTTAQFRLEVLLP